MDRYQLADTACCSCSRIYCCLDCARIAADHDGYESAAYMHLADQGYICCLYHRISCFDRCDHAAGLDHSKCQC